jgi:protein-disulfide isomerase
VRRYMVPITILVVIAFATTAKSQQVNNNTEQEILTELRQIRTLLEKNIDKPVSTLVPGANGPSNPPVRTVTIDVGDSPMLGSGTATITVVEFTDFQCPYCNFFYKNTFPKVKRDYIDIDSGRVRFYSMNLPLDMHPNALTAAQAGKCADDQGHFWQMFDLMQSNPQKLEMQNLMTFAGEVGLDIPTFQKCVESGKHSDAIHQAAQQAESMGARGTPSFVIGKSTAGGVEGSLFIGAQDYSFFEKLLNSLEQH